MVDAVHTDFKKPEIFLAEELLVVAEHRAVMETVPTTIPIFYNLYI